MFVSNPFALLTRSLSPLVMQVYAVLMIAAVVIGTLVDLRHKRTAEFFAGRREKSRRAAQEPAGDLFLDIQIVVPPADTPKARQAYEAMARDLAFDPRKTGRA
jgi:hypothetical protein